MDKKYDYSGKTVYVGIDVHKKTYSCVAICEGEVMKRDSMPADPKGLVRYLKRAFQGAIIKTAYEAGFSGFHLHRYLVIQGIDSQVVHPGSIEVASRDRVKTDKRDAFKIALHLSNGRLRGIYIPSYTQENQRSVTRLRANILKMRTQTGLRLKSLLFTQGLIHKDDDSRLSQSWIDKHVIAIKQGKYLDDFCFTVNQYAEEWSHLTGRLKSIRNQLETQAKSSDGLQDIYESVPGVALIHSRELINELGDMKQFKNEKQLFSYTGLTPSEYSSGEHTRHGHITRQGRPVLRRLLTEAAWVAITKDPNLRQIFERISTRCGKKRAIVGVARRLVGRMRSCIMNGTLYEIKDIGNNTVKKQLA